MELKALSQWLLNFWVDEFLGLRVLSRFSIRVDDKAIVWVGLKQFVDNSSTQQLKNLNTQILTT